MVKASSCLLLRRDDFAEAFDGVAGAEFVQFIQLADFDFGRDNPVLMPGSYWIALGFTGSPIINWFYTYGKPVGPVDGTRYKSVFQQNWSGALNYEFNYRVSGLTVK